MAEIMELQEYNEERDGFTATSERRPKCYQSKWYQDYQNFLEEEKLEVGDLIEFYRSPIYSHWGVWIGIDKGELNNSSPSCTKVSEFIDTLDQKRKAQVPLPLKMINEMHGEGLVIHRGNEEDYKATNLVLLCHSVSKNEGGVGKVLPASLKAVMKKSEIRINNSDDKSRIVNPIDEILKRCLERMDDTSADSEYHALGNNCEHFVKWVRNNEGKSWQSLMYVHRFALIMTSAAIILIAVAASHVYSSNGHMPSDNATISDNMTISYCCSSKLYEYNYTQDVNDFINSTNCQSHQFKTVPTWHNILGQVCVTCRRSRPGNNALFNTHEILFWVFAWLVVALLPWINSAILKRQNTSTLFIPDPPSSPQPVVGCQCQCHQQEETNPHQQEETNPHVCPSRCYSDDNINSKATNLDKIMFSLLSLPILAIAAFPIQNMVTQRCCAYVLFSLHPLLMAVMLFILLVSSCFRVPNIYKFSFKWKWFNNKMRGFTVAFTCFTALFAIYEADYLYKAFINRNDDTCDFHYWLFIVSFAGIFCISLVIGFIILVFQCFRSCGRVKWNDQGPEETCCL